MHSTAAPELARACRLQETLRVWSELGARDADQLKQLLIKRSLQPFTALAVQSLLDVVACGGEAAR